METINGLELYDIYSTWHIPFYQTTWFYWGMIILGTTALTSAALWIGKRYLRTRIQPKQPWQTALEQLKHLQSTTYTTKQDGKQCYFAMTTIMKEYLQKQHQLATIGKTDEELIRYLQKNTLLERHIVEQIETICTGCLYIKFANQDTVQKQITEHLELSIQIIKETRPHETERS